MPRKPSPSGIDFTPTIHADTYPFIAPSQFTLTNRAVLITGASKGCGREMALSFARAGTSKLAIAARSSMEDLVPLIHSAAKEAGKSVPQILTLELDVASESSVAAAAQRIKQEFGRLDILVNNAGYASPFTGIMDENVDDWWRTWEINIKGPFLITRSFLPLMLSSEDSLKTILNVSSIGAHNIGSGTAYKMSKLALLRFGEMLVEETKGKGVVCFGIHPGAVMTDLARNMPKEIHSVLTDTPQLAGDSVVWLTAGRRDWLNGRYVSCTWDMEELEGMKGRIVEGDLLKVRMDVSV